MSRADETQILSVLGELDLATADSLYGGTAQPSAATSGSSCSIWLACPSTALAA
jgi:hypothetical protein